MCVCVCVCVFLSMNVRACVVGACVCCCNGDFSSKQLLHLHSKMWKTFFPFWRKNMTTFL